MSITNTVKRRLSDDKVVVGPYIAEFYTAGLAGIVAACGADFAIFDYEHSGWGSEALRTQLALARGAGLVPIVNSPGDKFEREGLLLDIGAMGLMVPHVRTASQAAEIVAATRYAPQGNRGGAFGIAHDSYRAQEIDKTIAAANESILIIAKLESRQAIANAEAILSVPGIDVALVTAFDLALDMGLGSQVDHPDIAAAMSMVRDTCKRLGKSAGCAAFSPAIARRRVAEGYRFIQYSWDIGLLQEGLTAGVAAVRGGQS
jgi:2-dehydro-3-deoxyglucarate aldolase/4-hydroxy-2-oxoheptanedioate aldolase